MMIDYFTQHLWQMWSVLAVVCLILELMAGDFFIICFSIGAVFAALSAALGGNIYVQLICFAACALISLFWVRPFAKRYLRKGEDSRVSNADAIIMDIATFILVAIVICVVIFAKMALVIIPQSETKIVERLGRYYATLQPGINIIIPFIDRAKSIVVLNHGRYQYSTTIDLREQVYDFPKQNVITKDNVQTEINALLYFQIVDPFKATYEINNLPNAIEKLTQTTLRNIIGELELDETLTSRDTINKKLSAVLDDATDKWGVKVNRVELQDITPPDSVLTAMEKQMQAERNKRAQILTSEGQKAAEILASEGEKTAIVNKAEAAKQEAILQAEGEAQARIRVAEAEAKAIELITEAVGKSTNPANYLLAQKYIQMMQELAEGEKTKTVYLPYEATNLLGSLGGIKDLFKAE